MTSTFIAPLLLLSMFPHQEPRFLVPLIIPLVYLHAESILPERDMALERHVEKKKKKTQRKKVPSYLFLFWLIINMILTLFYGFIHQAGIYPATVDLSNELKMDKNSTFYVVTTHLYSIPKCLFLEKSTETLYTAKTTKYQLVSQVKLFQEGSRDLNEVINKLKIFRNMQDDNNVIYFIFPSSKEDELRFVTNDANITLKFTKCLEYFPHFSLEAFDDLFNFYPNYNVNYLSTSNLQNIFQKLKHLLTLKLCKISKN